MKKVMMQYEYNGEKFEIWETGETVLKKAWDEIDDDARPENGGWIYFEGNDEFIIVNGGFQ